MDDISALLALADRMLWVTALTAGPVLASALIVGLVVGIVQAATSVNEQTLTFVPKLIVISMVLIVLGSSMMTLIGDFAVDIFAQIARTGQEVRNSP